MVEHLIDIEDAETDPLACAAFLAEGVSSRDGRSESLKAIVPLYLDEGNVDMAAELANTVDDPFTRDRLLIAVAEKCASIDDDEYALQLAEAIEDHGLRSQAIERIAIEKAGKGAVEKARDLAADLEYPANVLAEIAIRQSADGDEEGARATIESIDYPAAAVSALLISAGTQIEKGEIDRAAGTLERAASAASDIEHSEEKIRLLVDTGNLFIDAGRNDKAVEVFEDARSSAEVLENAHRDPFLAAASLGFLRAGSLELADRTLDSVADKTQIATALLGYAREFWAKKDTSEALESLDEAYAILKSQRESETRNSRAKFALFSAIAAQYAAFGKGERAIEIAAAIEEPNERTAALSRVAQVATMQIDRISAEQALHAITDDADRIYALIGMSDAEHRAGDEERARALLDEAFSLTDSLDHLSLRASACNEIMKRLAARGHTARAEEILGTNLKTIATIRDDSRLAVTLAELAKFTDDAGLTIGENEKHVLADIIRYSMLVS